MVSFSDLGIEGHMVTALKQQGILEPFEVQREAIPDGMLGHDICCRAPTGSGKTLAFGLPLLSRTRRADVEMPTALILTPTRELAEQISKVLKPLAKAVGLEVLSVYGGTSYTPQRKALRNGVDVVIACPGRLLDLLDRGDLGLADVEVVVIDEADRMADMGFRGPVCDILDECSLERQTILFSATLDDEVAELVERYQHNPITIEVGPKEVSMDSMNHLFWMTKSHDKAAVASDAIKKSGRSIVFCRTRAGVDRVGDRLADQGIEVATLHGGLNQRQRDRAMQRFSGSRSQVLVATDVAARGIDIEGVNCVIHFDPPENGKAYKHRSGRTARAGAKGTVISLVQNPQRRAFQRIQKHVGIDCDFTQPDLEDVAHHAFEPAPRPEGERSERQGRGWWDDKRNRGRPRKVRGNRQQNGGRRHNGGRNRNHERNNRGSQDGGEGRSDRGGRHDRNNGGHRNHRNGRNQNGNRQQNGGQRNGNRQNGNRNGNRNDSGGHDGQRNGSQDGNRQQNGGQRNGNRQNGNRNGRRNGSQDGRHSRRRNKHSSANTRQYRRTGPRRN